MRRTPQILYELFRLKAETTEKASAQCTGRVLCRILNLGGVEVYEWGSGSAEPGVRGITPGKIRNFTCKILNFGAHLGKIITD
jgi:hypothetical protein